MSRFLIVGPRQSNAATVEAVFIDVVRGEVPDAAYACRHEPKSKLSKFFHRIVYSSKLKGTLIGKVLRVCFKWAWVVKLSDMEKYLNRNEETIIVFCMGTRMFDHIHPFLLGQIRRRYPKCKLVYYIIDGIEQTAQVNQMTVEKLIDYLKQYDVYLTYDMQDSERFGIPFADIPMTVVKHEKDIPTEYDLYFCGHAKGRLALIDSIDQKISEAGGKGYYPLSVIKQDGSTDNPHIEIIRWKPYESMIGDTLKSNCILELLAECNKGPTLRCKEAVVYNKKLLSNNPNLPKMPYYDARWMRYFEKIDDIDPKWVCEREQVDFGYKGDFSIHYFLKTVDELVSKQPGIT